MFNKTNNFTFKSKFKEINIHPFMMIFNKKLTWQYVMRNKEMIDV